MPSIKSIIIYKRRVAVFVGYKGHQTCFCTVVMISSCLIRVLNIICRCTLVSCSLYSCIHNLGQFNLHSNFEVLFGLCCWAYLYTATCIIILRTMSCLQVHVMTLYLHEFFLLWQQVRRGWSRILIRTHLPLAANVRPCNPGQPTESAKTIHCI